MRGVVAVMLVTVAGLSGCRQIFGLSDLPADAATIDTPDAGPCPAVGLSCSGPDTLLSCTAIGQQPTSTTCDWGCNPTGTAHCGALAPSGGGVTAMDVTTTTGLASSTLTAITTIDDTGAISGLRTPGTGTIVGIGFHITNNVAIYTFQDLTITNVINFTGTHPIALVSTSSLTIGAGAYLDLTGNCNNNNASAIAGGYDGGGAGAAGSGPGGGAHGTLNGGGAGGGFGAAGGLGGKNLNDVTATAGAAFGTPELAVLVGGGGGGGGAGSNGNGGAGAGAIQLVANGALTIAGKIVAGGCGGHHGATNGSGGGGGGAGGAILLEAHDIDLAPSTFLSVAGGGGGDYNGGNNGEDGRPDAAAAMGGGAGGDGGAVANIVGGDGGSGGGGGGAVGWLRLNTHAGSVPTLTDTVSNPTKSQNPTATTIGTAATQ